MRYCSGVGIVTICNPTCLGKVPYFGLEKYMADVRPFKGLRYNPTVVGDLSAVVCPPFDTITPQLQGSLYQRSPYNAVRLEAGETRTSNPTEENRYTRAAALLSDWREGQVLVRDQEPAYYLVEHTFKLRGDSRVRMELIACVRLEKYQRGVVLPHEFTREDDKRDRLALLEACHTNFSPVMCLYRDNEKQMYSVFQRAMEGPALVDFSDAGGQGYRVWKINDLVSSGQIREIMSAESLYIADGHHRYETALRYKGQLGHSRGGDQTGDDAFNYVMMGLIEFDDPGLTVLPYHRVLGGLSNSLLDKVKVRLRELFEPIPDSNGDQEGLEGFLDKIAIRGRDQLVMGITDAGDQSHQLLALKQGAKLDSWGPIGESEAWILEEQILKPILGDTVDRYVDYFHDADEAEYLLKKGKYQLGIYLKPFPLAVFEEILNTGQRLPPKSTFFYPKLATGLVFNPLEGSI